MSPYARLGLMYEYAVHTHAPDGYARGEYSPFIPHVHTAVTVIPGRSVYSRTFSVFSCGWNLATLDSPGLLQCDWKSRKIGL